MTTQSELPMVAESPRVPMTPLGLLQAAVERGCDPEQLGKLMDLQERYERNEAAQAFAASLALFQAKCPMIQKTRMIDLGQGAGPMYAGLDDIMRAIAPLLAECGLSITFSADITTDGKMHVICNVRHGRHLESSHITLSVPAQMRVNDTQKMAAALSYGKRYSLCAALNITVTDEDTDANGMAQPIDEAQAATLREWIANVGADEKKFLSWLAIERLADLPASRFDEALQALKRKAKR